MAVSLKKQTPIMREITPVHLIDEEDTIVKPVRSEPASKPETLKIEVVGEKQLPKIIEAVSETEVTEQGSFPSYSQLARNGRQEHLAEVFQIPTEQERSIYQKIKEQLMPSIQKSHKCETGLLVALCAALLSFLVAIAMLCLSQWLFMSIGIGLFALACLAMYLSIRISPYDIDAAPRCNELLHLAETICETDVAQGLFVCSSGADTKTTWKKLKYRQSIYYRIFRPLHCDDSEVFKAITEDEHNVFMIYDETYEQVICVDPLLFK